ncbi:type II secretion system F family protein [Nocardia stercoris]|uniref:Type II secretion system F family protein n=2 Tax=Nocardia stercoris TaxID=2483361 RepID=A0A3M2KVZ4_9NOCA|nr:type II secretion system F family protein [Nocardia stercoris]
MAAAVWASAAVAGSLVLLPTSTGSGLRLRALSAGAAPQPAGPDKRPRLDPLAAASALDLLAGCLRSGLPVAVAARAVAPIAPQPLGTALAQAAGLLALGADPTVAWQRAADDAADEDTTALARLACRSARSGAALADAVTELAQQRRGAIEDAAAARAERAGVLISGPLGLCFLPAFVCLGIVPVVIGLAGRVLGAGLR